MGWEELLGKKQREMPDTLRRERWEKWKQVATEQGEEDTVEYWTSPEACENCIHRDDDWCQLMELPITVNPILTMDHGMIGMACMGAGKELPGQKEIEFEEETQLPF